MENGRRQDGQHGGPSGFFLGADVFEEAAGAVFVLAAGGLRCTGGTGRFLGRSREEMFWRDVRDFLHSGDREKLEIMISRARASPGALLHGEACFRDASGALRDVELTVQNVLEAPSRGDAGLVVVAARDVSGRKARDGDLIERAFRDSLTGLPNRALLSDRLEHALSKRDRNQVAVLFLDLDGFKVVNDSMGHETGDGLLVTVAERLRGCVRPQDTVARLGGDEFVVVMEGADGLDGATSAARRILDAMKQPVTVGGVELFASPSIGIALDQDGLDEPEKLLRAADTAMYRAKDGGKARFEIFEAGTEQGALARLRLETDLRRAAADPGREFVLHYQPKVNLRSGRIVGMEALLRWEHPERGLLPPSEFVPLAEERGHIVPIGRWVLAEACRQARDWQDRHPDATIMWVAVNLSVRQLAHPEIAEHVVEALSGSGLDPENLSLEITETVLVEDADAAVQTLARLKQLGVQIEIDDFGTGYSSLSYLRRFPADFLKIDDSFVDTLEDEGTDSTITGAVISLAHALGMRVVGEGVETAGQLECLKALGCDLAQGYYFSRPLPKEGMDVLLAEGLHTRRSW